MRQVNMNVVQMVHYSFFETTVATELSHSYQAVTRSFSQATQGALQCEGLFDGHITEYLTMLYEFRQLIYLEMYIKEDVRVRVKLEILGRKRFSLSAYNYHLQ